MAHPLETRSGVRRKYIEGMPLKGAALLFEVSYDTARTWKAQAKDEGDDWDVARAAWQVGDQGLDELNKNLVENFTRHVLLATRELDHSSLSFADRAKIMAQLSDAYVKFSQAFSRVNPEMGALSVAMDTLTTTAGYLRGTDPAALRTLQPHLDAVGAILGKRYG